MLHNNSMQLNKKSPHQFAEIHIIDSHDFAFVAKLRLFFILAKFNCRQSRTRQSKLNRITPNFSLMRHSCFGLMFYNKKSYNLQIQSAEEASD